jgi:hypothetical protein
MFSVGQDSGVGMATRYGLGGQGIELRGGGGDEIFSTRSHRLLGPTQPAM